MPVVETVEWNGVTWRRYPESKRRNHRVYYQRHTKADEPPLYLHREIYKAHYGEIPEGSHIHHKDENPSNNDPDNLECVTVAEHRRRHGGVCTEKMRRNLEVQRAKASAWHGSPEGLAWHRANGFKAYSKRPFVDHVCKVCGKSFRTKSKSSSMCSDSCREKARPPRALIHAGICLQCGGPTLAEKKGRQFCSYRCSGIARGAARRAAKLA